MAGPKKSRSERNVSEMTKFDPQFTPAAMETHRSRTSFGKISEIIVQVIGPRLNAKQATNNAVKARMRIASSEIGSPVAVGSIGAGGFAVSSVAGVAVVIGWTEAAEVLEFVDASGVAR